MVRPVSASSARIITWIGAAHLFTLASRLSILNLLAAAAVWYFPLLESWLAGGTVAP
eukprot:COSAG02_NODE_1327_length_13220_cov_11.602241_11_plen_57_part_00